MKFKIFSVLVVISMMTLFIAATTEKPTLDPQRSLFSLLNEHGEQPPLHYVENVDPALAAAGEGIIKQGHGHFPDGSTSKRQSKHFVCTDCHNVVQEDPFPADPDPEARRQMAFERGLPILQGTTLWGIVNRETWYNGDYYKKYGDLVTESKDTLVNAIQLCATVCSQGRALNDMEMEAVLHYLWSIQVKVGDLNMPEEEQEKLIQDELDPEQKRALIKQYYMTASPARFVDAVPPADRQYGILGDPAKGKVLYEQSCMHCHAPSRNVTNFTLDAGKLDLKHLASNLSKTKRTSVYEIVRSGTYSIPGYKPYMPHYTADRMSDQQIEDLVAFIKQQSKKK